MTSGPESEWMTSSPSPPATLSAPPPAWIVSLPGPPSSRRAAAPASSCRRPRRRDVVVAEVADEVSLPAPPSRRSSPEEPSRSRCRRCRACGRDPARRSSLSSAGPPMSVSPPPPPCATPAAPLSTMRSGPGVPWRAAWAVAGTRRPTVAATVRRRRERAIERVISHPDRPRDASLEGVRRSLAGRPRAPSPDRPIGVLLTGPGGTCATCVSLSMPDGDRDEPPSSSPHAPRVGTVGMRAAR